MELDEKISIIIPVYQVEAYLPRCLNSVISQTYNNLEIILVDDGSPDRCGQICDAYARKDARIRVIHKQNEGVARARNDGLACASGAYISFIDSDDWIAEHAYELLYQGLKKYDADCAVGACVHVIEDPKTGALRRRKEKKASADAPAVCEDSMQAVKRVLLQGSAVWNRLFKREIFAQVRFPAGRIGDDEAAVLHAYAECKKVVLLNQETYFYRIRPNSITTTPFSQRKMDIYYNSVDNLRFIRKNIPELTACAEYKYMKAMLYCYVQLRKMKRDATLQDSMLQLRQEIRKHQALARKNPYLPWVMKILMQLCAIAG